MVQDYKNSTVLRNSCVSLYVKNTRNNFLGLLTAIRYSLKSHILLQKNDSLK